MVRLEVIKKEDLIKLSKIIAKEHIMHDMITFLIGINNEF